jgi:hypothetical protein
MLLLTVFLEAVGLSLMCFFSLGFLARGLLSLCRSCFQFSLECIGC